MYKLIKSFIFLFLVVGCSFNSENKPVVTQVVDKPVVTQVVENSTVNEPVIEQSEEEVIESEEVIDSELQENNYETDKVIDNPLGFVALRNICNTLDSATTVTLLNNDGSIWMTFSYDYGPRMEKISMGEKTWDMKLKTLFPTWKHEFSPWAFYIDGYLDFLVFKCVAVHEDSYDVIVNGDTKLIKTLKKDSAFALESWPIHLQHSLISFTSQWKSSPNENATNAKAYPGEDCILAVEIKDEWAKLATCDDSTKTGWIKWRDGDKLLISLWYAY